jgi:hypothetical protein
VTFKLDDVACNGLVINTLLVKRKIASLPLNESLVLEKLTCVLRVSFKFTVSTNRPAFKDTHVLELEGFSEDFQ